MSSTVSKKTGNKYNPLLDADSTDSDSDSGNGFGIYGQKINQTKQGIRKLHEKEIKIEGNFFCLKLLFSFNVKIYL